MKSLAFVAALVLGPIAMADSQVTSSIKVGNKTLLTDRNNMTVYTFDMDQGSTSTCYNACAKEWPPVLLKSGEAVSNPLGTTARKDGSIQLTFNGKPLYLYVDDQKPGDDEGNDYSAVWHDVEL